MRVAPEEFAVDGKLDLFERLADPRSDISSACVSTMGRDDLDQLRLDPQRWVECRSGILRHVRDDLAARGSKLSAVATENLLPGYTNRARGDPRAALRVTKERERNRSLSGAGLTDKTDDLATLDGERDPVHNLLPSRRQFDAKAGHLEGGHRVLPRRSTPAIALAIPSATRFVPIAKRAMHVAGATTAHARIVRIVRFSLIIRPQSAFGG